MPAYAYTGMNAAGKSIKGVETAESVGALKAAMKRNGVYLTAVTETSAARAARGSASSGGIEIDLGALFDRVTPKMVSDMTRLLSTLLCAGVTLPESLLALTEQVESPRFKAVLGAVAARVNEGSSLADAMAVHPRAFPQLYVDMVRAGEASGSLETVLIRIADFMDQQEELRTKVTTAMVYPVLLGLVGFAVVIMLMVKVVPNIAEMFAEQNAQLPFSTRFLMWSSGILSRYWLVFLALAIVSVIVFRRFRASPEGRRLIDGLLLRLPVLGDLIRKIAIARFSRTLATMLASGVALLEALDIVRGLLGNVVLEQVVTKARDEIREGAGIAPALKRSNQFPSLVTHMIAVGERSGQLEQMLTDIADAYDREASTAITRTTALLEPMMILVMAVSVGFIVFSIMTPIIQMNQNFGH